ncbi:hypothetical protein GCM10008944_11310 [Cytobacillus oceanisediminis]
MVQAHVPALVGVGVHGVQLGADLVGHTGRALDQLGEGQCAAVTARLHGSIEPRRDRSRAESRHADAPLGADVRW